MFNLRRVSRLYLMPLLCALSLLASSVDAQGYCGYPAQFSPQPCYQQPYCAQPYYPQSVGVDFCGYLIPALAGAGTAAAVVNGMKKQGKVGKSGRQGVPGADGADGKDGERGHNGPDGHAGKRGGRGHGGGRGECGPKGEEGNFCQADIGQNLEFIFMLDLTNNLSNVPANSVIIPFVETPEGIVIEGEPFELDEESEMQTSALTLNNPCYGTYHFGLFIPSLKSANGSAMGTFSVIVNTSRNFTTTQYMESVELVGGSPSNRQHTFDFTYFINDEEPI